MKILSVRLLLIGAISLLLNPGQAWPDIEDSLDQAPNQQQNLTQLAQLFRNLQSAGLPGGELSTVLDQLDASANPTLVRRSLRNLLPDVTRQNAVKQRLGNTARARKSILGNTHAINYHRPTTKPTSTSSILNFDNYQAISATPNAATQVDWWLQTWADDARQDDQDGFDGFDASQTGVALGADIVIDDHITLGINIGQSSGEVDSDSFGKDEIDGREYALTASYSKANHTLSAQLARTTQEIDRARLMVIETETQLRAFQLTADIDATLVTSALNYSYSFAPKDWSTRTLTFTPFISLTHVATQTDDYQERGSDTLSLGVKTDDESQLASTIGGSLSWAYFKQNWAILPSISLAWDHDIQSDPTVTTSHFRDTLITFNTEGYEIDADRLRFALGISFLHRNNVGIGLSYQGERKGNYQYDGLIFNIQVSL